MDGITRFKAAAEAAGMDDPCHVEVDELLKEIWEACRIGVVVIVAGVRPPPGAARTTSRMEKP